jgi:hypothetical protein
VTLGKDNAPTTNPNAFVGEMTSSVYRALAHLSSLASSSSVHRKNFSRDVVACMLEDIWPDVQKVRDSCFSHSSGTSDLELLIP